MITLIALEPGVWLFYLGFLIQVHLSTSCASTIGCHCPSARGYRSQDPGAEQNMDTHVRFPDATSGAHSLAA